MQIKGVLTGDIVQSTRIDPADREQLLETIGEIAQKTKQWGDVKLEIFRGDSFQLVTSNPVEALRTLLLMRAGLKKNSPATPKWDARIALGLGTVAFDREQRVAESDGEAFRHSGREFDELGKTHRMAIRTPWEEVNRELAVSTAFADNVVSGWSPSQAQIIYYTLLTEKKQKEVATDLNKSPQAVSKSLMGGKFRLIELYLNRYRDLIRSKIEKRDGME